MNEDFGEPSGLPCPDFSPYPLTKIEDSGPDNKPPAKISKAVFCRIEGESCDVVGVDGVSDETASSVGVKGYHEEECEVVGIPEGLKALAADFMVGGGVHDKHDEQHEVTSDATSLFVMDILRGDLADFCIGYQEEGKNRRLSERSTYGSARH